MRAVSRAARQGGVTLIEVAIAVVVIAILLAIGIPRYRQHVLRVKSVDAVRELQTLKLRLERCHQRTGSYTRLDDVPNACASLPYTIPEGTYRMDGDITADTFALTATPVGSQEADAQCNAFTLDQSGRQGITGTGTPENCWRGRQK